MKQVAGLITTYSSDEFGICSALYELGGMVVMHDASGCNSTYTTHDEPRWYDMDSMIFISAISEMEAVMGDDEKLIRDIAETAGQLKPKFIAIVGAPIPYMTGTDFEAIAGMIEEETGIPCMGFAANGMNHYTKGISMALEALVERFCGRGVLRRGEFCANILGATPLDFSLNGSVEAIEKWLEEQGIPVNTCFAMGSSLEEITQAGRAHVNLVVSYGGLAAAERLWAIFGIPYVVGVPFGKRFAERLVKLLGQSAAEGENIVAYQEGQRAGEEENHGKRRRKSFAVIGESVCSASLATAIEMEHEADVRVFCMLDTSKGLLREKDVRTPDEDDLMEHLREVEGVIADPMFEPLCVGKIFYPLPHEACSGRIYDEASPNLVNVELDSVVMDSCEFPG